ncbi:MAG TPA: phosphatase PAP2 family protein [Polyangiaceae bacterium]|nr:phosphatase PAP2 family protein [Polyangiaceae bacterium]
MSLSPGQHTVACSPRAGSGACTVCAILLGGSMFLLEPRAFAQQSVPVTITAPGPSATPAEKDAPAAAAAEQAAPAKVPPAPRTYETLVSVNAPPPLVWKWARFSTANYLITGLGGALTLATAIVHPRAQHSLNGGLWFDEDVRNALRVDTLPNRYIFRDASDVGLSLMATWPFVADALTTAWWYRGSREAAQEMALIDLETLAISGAVQGVTNVLVSRERPYGRDCGSAELPADSIDCANPGRYRSFFSGHSAFSFTSAALICVHHFKNDLIGAPWDALSCAGGYAVATTTATFRVVSDMHYATDVLTGALVGTLVGYGVPLLHYSQRDTSATTFAGIRLNLIPTPGGLGVLGIF